MRTGLAYTSARILMLVVTFIVLYLCGVRSMIVLLAVSFFVSAIASYILLSKQREQMADALNRRLSKTAGKVTRKAAEFRERLDEGAAAEDAAADDAASAEDAVARAQATGNARQTAR